MRTICSFEARPLPVKASFTSRGLVLEHREAGARRGGERDAARLAEDERRARRDAGEDLLDRDLGGPARAR